MRDSSFLLDRRRFYLRIPLTKLVDLRDKALAELKLELAEIIELELAEIIEEIILDRLQELAGLSKSQQSV